MSQQLGPSYGIPGGGLFNEIFNSHLRAIVTETTRNGVLYEKVSQNYVCDNQSEADSDNDAKTLSYRLFVSFVVTSALVFFVCVPLVSKTELGSLFAGFLLIILPPLVFVAIVKLLGKKRNRKDDNARTAKKLPREVIISRHPSLGSSKASIYADELNKEMTELYNEMTATGNVPRCVNMDIAGFKLFYGAAAEVTTAHALRTIPGATVYNDVELRNERGEVSANIDHIAHINEQAIMVDAKWWSKPPMFERDQFGNLAVSPKCSHKRAVSTCLYEASFLTRKPGAIVFAIRGKSADQLAAPAIIVNNYYHFVPTDDDPKGIYAVPFPVIFADYRHIANVVYAVANGGGYVAGCYIPGSKGARFSERELKSLPVTTSLDFGPEKNFS